MGKTSLILRYVRQVFAENQQATIQASFLTKKLTLGNSRVKLAIWDTAGQERFHALGPIYYRDADAALLVYDITDRDSFNRVKNWVKELRKFVQKDIVVVIAANKQDLVRNQQIPDDESQDYAKSISAGHFKTSAKAGKGVKHMFLNISRQLLAQRAAEASAAAPAGASGGGATTGLGSTGRKRGLIISDEPAESSSKTTCC